MEPPAAISCKRNSDVHFPGAVSSTPTTAESATDSSKRCQWRQRRVCLRLLVVSFID